MFLYLSKLLPLFVYPVGLACILIILSIATRKWTAVSFVLAILAVGVLIVFSNGWVAGRLARSLEWRYLPHTETPEADAIVLLGGATRAAIYPRGMTEMNEAGDRLLAAARLYRDGRAPVIIASGGAIDWLGSATPEAEGMQEILEFVGVPASAIIVESSAQNTYENAIRVREIAETKDIRRILLVTSALHTPRSVGIFEKQGFDVIPAPSDFMVTHGDEAADTTKPAAVLHQLMPDVQYLALSTRALKEYLGILVYRMRGWM